MASRKSQKKTSAKAKKPSGRKCSPKASRKKASAGRGPGQKAASRRSPAKKTKSTAKRTRPTAKKTKKAAKRAKVKKARPTAAAAKTARRTTATKKAKASRGEKRTKAKAAASTVKKGKLAKATAARAKAGPAPSMKTGQLAGAPASNEPPPEVGQQDSSELRPKTHLSADQLDDFRRRLLDKRAALVGDVDNLTNEALRRSRSEAAGDLSSMPIHMADIGSDNWEQEFTLGLIDNERSLLREIDEALHRIEERTYGVCLATHKPISVARLRAKPWAKYCIEYARLHEQGRAP
jgi:RNA polymerase-binding protein DksA